MDEINELDAHDFYECCPDCGAIWGIDEIEWGKCFACGYREGIDFEDNDDLWSDDYEPDDEDG